MIQSTLKPFESKPEQETSCNVDIAKYDSADIIARDVCIIGGGAAGTFAAIQLQSKDKSVVFGEKQGRLGG